MDRLLAMQVFATVVDTGSFARAAERLNISATATSRYVAELERHVHAQLLLRSTRRLSLTETGAAYYERVRQILADVDEAEELAAEAEARPRGVLRVSLPHTFGLRYVAPLMPEFCARYPELELEVSFTDRLVDLLAEGVDVAIRIGLDLRTTLVARRLAPIQLVAVASPGYVERRGAPRTPEELRDHDCITYALAEFGDTWKFSRAGEDCSVQVRGSFRSNDGDMVGRMAVAGRGVCLQPTFIVGDDLRSGALVRVLPEYELATHWAHAVYMGGARRSARVRAFVSYFAEAFGGEHPVWDAGLQVAD